VQNGQEEECKLEPRHEKEVKAQGRLRGYWCSTYYSEVEPFIRGNIKITLLDDVKADRMVHRDEALNCLSLLLEQKESSWPRHALVIVANLAASGIPSLAYELVIKWKTHEVIYTTMEQHPELLDAACCALVGLFVSGRSATRRALLSSPSFLRALVDGLLVAQPPQSRSFGIMGLWAAGREIECSNTM